MSVSVSNEGSYPTKTVTRLIHRTLADLDVSSPAVLVRVVDSHNQWATGYWEFHDSIYGRATITVRIPRRGVEIGDYHPYERKREMGRRFPLADWREALVAIVAHEGEHHRQRWNLGERPGRRARHSRPGAGFRRVDVELRCDLAAYRAWKRYREARRLSTEEAGPGSRRPAPQETS